MLSVPGGIVPEGAVQFVAHAVGFDVRLVIDIEAQAVTQFVEFPRLGIVAGADGVDIGHLHELEVLQDVLLCQVVAGVGVVLMHVHALELDRLAVHEEGLHIAVAVLHGRDLDPAESYMEPGVFPAYAEQEGIEFRRLGSPFPYLRDGVRHRNQFAAEFENGVRDAFAVLVQQFVKHLYRFLGTHFQGEYAFRQGRVQGGDHAEVEPGGRLLGGEVHVALDAADAPEILALQPGAGGITVHLERQVVVASFQGARDVKTGQTLGILRVADFLPVDIHIGTRLDAGEVQEHRPAIPSFRDGESPVVDGSGEHLRQHGRLRIPRAEVVRNVGVDGHAVPLHLPVARHRDPVPGFVILSDSLVILSDSLVILSGSEESFHLVVIVEILEIPRPVQIHVVLALTESLCERIGPVGEPDGFGPLRLRIHGGDIHVLPVGQGLGGGRGGKDEA